MSTTVFDKTIFKDATTSLKYVHYAVPNGYWTMSSPDFPYIGGICNVFFIPGRATSGGTSTANGVAKNKPITILVTNGYYTVAYRSGYTGNTNNPINFNWAISDGQVPPYTYKEIVDDIYQNEPIKCAKLWFFEPGSYKFPQIVNDETDYEFQMVAKSSVATTLTIQVGDTVKTQAITTDFTRFVIPFPSVTNDVDSLYITFPAGTYWLYNLQLERASTPSAWRPAPEDAEDYADKAAQQAVDDQTQLDVFNKLTNNGASQGIYLLDGQLYINGEYIAANTISGNKINGGVISGTEINIGGGVFTVDDEGEVNASNLNMTGGSINLETDNQTYDFIRLLYSMWESVFRAQSFTTSFTNSLQNRKYQVVVHPLGISGYLDANQTLHGLDISMPSATGSSNSGGITIYDGEGKARVLITRSGISFYAENGTTNICKLSPPLTASSDAFATLQLNDGAGTRRVLLDATGLKFYNASGTLTKTYSAT